MKWLVLLVLVLPILATVGCASTEVSQQEAQSFGRQSEEDKAKEATGSSTEERPNY